MNFLWKVIGYHTNVEDACCVEWGVICREVVVDWKRETCESGACSQDIDTRETGSFTRAGAS